MDEDQKQRMIELLKSHHHFPGPYHLSLVTLNEPAVVMTMRALVEEGGPPIPDAHWELRPSSGGKYVSHRVRVHVDSAHHVIAIYERLAGTTGLVSVM